MSPTELPLIRTKLAPPRMGSAPVSRDGLLQQLDARRDCKLILVLGPAGCGKTTLLAQWRKQLFLQGANVAWYYAGPDDDDGTIVTYMIEAVRQAGVPVDAEGLHVFTRSGGKVWKPLLTSLINSFAEASKDTYLVIDDFHCVSSYAILQLLDRWLALAPPRFHLVLASRLHPPLALDLLRSADQLHEVKFTDLRFGLEETQRFVSAQGLTGLNASQVHSLHDMTDGWAAGLQMLTFSLRKQGKPEAFFERQRRVSLSREDALHSYMAKTVAENLSDDELNFLTRISACRRFNRELCQLLTGNPNAGEYLDRFVSDNLFVIPIDTGDTEPWYRFHRLFAGFLNSRLDEGDRGELRKLHQLASHWFAGKNLHVEALRHAELAEDVDFCVELVDRAARSMINSVSFIQFLKLCDSLPRERLRTHLNVCLCMGWAQLSCSRIEDFDRTMEDVARHPSRNKSEVRLEVQLLKAYRALRVDDTASSLKIVQPMLDEPPPANPFHLLLMYNIVGLGMAYANRFETAREIARARNRHDTPEQRDNPKPFMDMVQGFSHLVQGNIRTAADLLTPVLEASQRGNAYDVDAAGVVAGYLIEARYHLDELDEARALLERHYELIQVVCTADGVLYASRVRARIEQADGNIAAARQTLLKLEETGYRLGLDRLVAWSVYEQVLLNLRQREHASVPELLQRLDQLAQRHQQQQDCLWSEIPLAALMAHADAAVYLGDAEEAMAAIDAASAAAQSNRRQPLMTRLGLLRALVLLQQGQTQEAVALAAPLFNSAVDHGMKRVLTELDEIARPLTALLAKTTLSPAARACLPADSLLAAAAPRGVKPTAEGSALLSLREREVLDLLSRALSIKSIARGLNLSPGTVKWHLKNIYGKLGAVSREDALAKARGFGLIAQ